MPGAVLGAALTQFILTAGYEVGSCDYAPFTDEDSEERRAEGASPGILVGTHKRKCQDCDSSVWLQGPTSEPPPYCSLVGTGGGDRNSTKGGSGGRLGCSELFDWPRVAVGGKAGGELCQAIGRTDSKGSSQHRRTGDCPGEVLSSMETTGEKQKQELRGAAVKGP